VTPFDVAPPLFPWNFGTQGGAYGDANCGALGVHGVPLSVVPVPTATFPDAGYFHG